jgi:hypothetical protein
MIASRSQHDSGRQKKAHPREIIPTEFDDLPGPPKMGPGIASTSETDQIVQAEQIRATGQLHEEHPIQRN